MSEDTETMSNRLYTLKSLVSLAAEKLRQSCVDLLPILSVIGFFQIVVIRQPLPNFTEVVAGSLLVVLGLTLFVQGLEMALFPIGESLAQALARKGSLVWLLLFSFLLGFSTTIAEPALIAIARESAEIASKSELIGATEKAISSYAMGLRITVAASVGVAILIGTLRIIRGWPLHYLIIGGYIMIMVMTVFAPPEIIGIAYDAGGVTTSTVTVPLVTALGVGLASIIRGRNPLVDGFGLIAFASLLPMVFVMGYGMFIFN